MGGRITIQIPDSLKLPENHEPGRRWIYALPDLFSELARMWGLEPGKPFRNANVSYVVPVRSGAEDAVLKIQRPHQDTEAA